MDGLQWKTLLKWMIWGYHYFRKDPYIAPEYQCLEQIEFSFEMVPFLQDMLIFGGGVVVIPNPDSFVRHLRHKKTTSYFPLYWLFPRDPYNGL